MKLLTNPKHGDTLDAMDTPYPCRMIIVGKPQLLDIPNATAYGYVIEGDAIVEGRLEPTDIGEERAFVSARVREGAYFSLSRRVAIEPSQGALLAIIIRYGFIGQPHIGAIEKVGRLSYIDGCSDTLLIPPPRMGDPCFNFLHFPKGVVQTQHIHPTIRAGIVARGNGYAYQLASKYADGWIKPLTKGCVFILDPQEIHSFRTDRRIDEEYKIDNGKLPGGEDYKEMPAEEMDVIAFHPDSDFGPTDTNHPMLNRTYINHGK